VSKYFIFGLGKLDPEKIINALTAPESEGGMGFKREHIETGKRSHLRGFQGRERKEQGDIIIRRRYLRGSANDIGFLRKDNGEWEFIESGYDGGYRDDGSKRSAGAQRDFQKRFGVSYKIETAKERAKAMRKSKRIKGNWDFNGVVKREGTKIWVEIEEQ
jgi:hypothetical protein